ncbi:MAG: RDD family protein, partial [Mariprofundaceae bacterium]|nr:RDD family protein [Mariprofundaceae bacterium]
MAETARPKAQRAGIVLRLLAACYDVALLVGIGFIAFIPVSIVEQQIGTTPDWAKQLLFMAVAYGYFAGFWFKAGATTGMRPWKLRVAMVSSGDPVTLFAATARFFALMLTWLALAMTLLYLFGHYTG